eukprot:SAG31_NODE_2115_length_6416_cov_20.056989_2_plen_108_part_00
MVTMAAGAIEIRWCKKCKALFDGKACSNGHANFMYLKKIPPEQAANAEALAKRLAGAGAAWRSHRYLTASTLLWPRPPVTCWCSRWCQPGAKTRTEAASVKANSRLG